MHCITSAILIWLAIQTCLGIGDQRQKATSCAEQHTCVLEPRQHSLCGGVNSSLWLVKYWGGRVPRAPTCQHQDQTLGVADLASGI